MEISRDDLSAAASRGVAYWPYLFGMFALWGGLSSIIMRAAPWIASVRPRARAS